MVYYLSLIFNQGAHKRKLKLTVGPSLTNKVRNKETNKKMHDRNIRSGWDLNQGLPDKKPIP